MQNTDKKRKNKLSSNKQLVAVIIIVILAISTFAWHEYRAAKRDKAAAAQQIYED